MQIREWFGHFCRTVLRMYQQPYSHEWDVQLNQLLDQGTVVNACKYTLTLHYEGTYYVVWTSNRWFAFGHLYQISDDPGWQYRTTIPDADWRRLRFRTMQRLWAVYALHRRVFRG
ncbi:TPA: hypothetical protein N2X72_004195 [Escherichia coli]|nr:hypothetical protein [Escherichia coli]